MNIIRLDKKWNNNKAYIYKSPIGNLILSADDTSKYMVSLSFYLDSNMQILYDDPPVIKKAKIELDNYFSKKTKIFTVPLALYGTDFQYKIWLETYKIPFGKIVTYSYISSASRAVGNAESKNNIAIIIPCHRVVGANKKLTGYAGGLDKKEYLLKHEGFNISNSKIMTKL